MSNGSVNRTADIRHGSTKRRAESDQIPYKDDETVRAILDDTIHAGVLDAITVTDAGGLNVTWSAGEVYTPAGDIVQTVSGGDACADDTLCFLVWASGTGLTLRATRADPATEVDIAHISVGDGDIYDIHEESIISETMPSILDGLAEVLPIVVTSGCLVSATNPGVDLEVSVSTGVFHHEVHNRHPVTGFDTSTASTLIRCNINAGGPLWNFVTGQDEADLTKWNDGNNLVATNPAKYYRGMFVISESNVFWIYSQEEFANLNAALNGDNPTIPAGIATFPRSIAYIYQDGDVLFEAAGSEQWIDIRPLLGVSVAGTAGGLNNVVEDNTPQLGGTLDSNGNVIQMKTTDKLAFHDTDVFIQASADGNMLIEADTLVTLGKLGTTEFGDGTLRVARPQTTLKMDWGDPTHWWNNGYIAALRTVAGAGTATPLVGGVIDVNTTSAGNVDAAETDLMSYTLPADTLATNHDSIEIIAAGISVGDATNKRVRLKFGSVATGFNTIFDTGSAGQINGFWQIRATIIRTGAATQVSTAHLITPEGGAWTIQALNTSPTRDTTIDLVVKVTGQGTITDKVTQTSMQVIYHPAP